jgi:two-component system KDP operon response regulator KdpE
VNGLAKILVIEDDPVIMQSLCEALRDAGYETVAAHNVARGREQARWARPHLILLDLGLPDGSGLEILEVLAETDSLVPVLVLTGLDPADVKMSALRSGVQQFLKKPVRKPALLHAVAKLVATSKDTRDRAGRIGATFDWQDSLQSGSHRR